MQPNQEGGGCHTRPMIRYTSAPTKFDKAPFGMFCSVLLNDEGTEQELYVQASPLEGDPHWISAQDLLVTAFKEQLKDVCFLEQCLAKITTTIPS